MRPAPAFLAGVLSGLTLAIPARRALIHYSEHSLTKPDYAGPRYFHNGRPTPTPEGFTMKYADVQSKSHPSDRLRFSPNADTVRVTLAHFDEFDACFDKETLIGDFPIDELKAALNSLDRPTAAIRLREPAA